MRLLFIYFYKSFQDRFYGDNLVVDILKKNSYQGQKNISNFQVTEIGCKSEEVQQIKHEDWQLYFEMDSALKDKYVKHLAEIRLEETFVTNLNKLIFQDSARIILIILDFIEGTDKFNDFSKFLKDEIVNYSKDDKKELVKRLLAKNSNTQLHVLFQGNEYFDRESVKDIALKCLRKAEFRVIQNSIKKSYRKELYKYLTDFTKLVLVENLHEKFTKWVSSTSVYRSLENKLKDRMKFSTFLTLLFINKNEYDFEGDSFEFSNEESIENLIDTINGKLDIIIDDNCLRFFEIIDDEKTTSSRILHNQLEMPLTLFREEYQTTIKPILNSKLQPFCYDLDPPLSSGQKSILFIFARMEAVIKKVEKENMLILLDEADLTLHPEWQRQFIDDLTIFLKEFKEKNFYVLYATHSPMILSDITDDRIVFLKKEGDYSIDKSIQDKKLTFGANIYDLYHDSFFMDKYMGEFAFNKINDVINIVNLYKISKEIEQEVNSNKKTLRAYRNHYDVVKIFHSYRNRYGKNIEKDCKKVQETIEDDIDALEKTARKIGESLLRNRILKDIGEIGIEDDKKIIQLLKVLSVEERNEQLSKYSKQKQIELLKKLLDGGVGDDKS